MKRKYLYELILKDGIVYYKGTEEQIKNKFGMEKPLYIRKVSIHTLLEATETKGVKIIL